MRLSIVLLILLLVLVGFPLLGGVSLPPNFDPAALGRFIADLLSYWQTLFANVAR